MGRLLPGASTRTAPPCTLPTPARPHRAQHVDGINLFGLISIASLLYCAPLAVICEGAQWPAALQASAAPRPLRPPVRLPSLPCLAPPAAPEVAR